MAVSSAMFVIISPCQTKLAIRRAKIKWYTIYNADIPVASWCCKLVHINVSNKFFMVYSALPELKLYWLLNTISSMLKDESGNLLTLGVIDEADSCSINASTHLTQHEVITVNSAGQLKIWDLRQPGLQPASSV